MLPGTMLRLTEYLNRPINSTTGGRVVELADLTELPDYLLGLVTDTNVKGSAGYLVAAPVQGRRGGAAAQPTRLIALDYDDSPDGPAWDTLARWPYFAHTTDSHLVVCAKNPHGWPRWRVWLELDREYTAAEVARAVCPLEGAHLRSIAQPAFIPTQGDAIEWDDHTRCAAEPVCLEEWAAAVAAAPTPTRTGPRVDPTPAWVNAFVARVVRNPDRTNECYAAAASALAAGRWTNDEIRAAMLAWTPGHPELPGRHLSSALRAADTRRDGGVVPGYPRLAELGIPWAEERGAAEDVSAIIAAAHVDAPEDTPFRFTSARAAAEYELKPVNWLSEQLVMAPGAPSLITGYGGSGKTTFIQHLALAVATPGALLLGQYPVRHGSVAHIDHEQGLDLTIRRYRAQGLTGSESLDFCSFPAWRVGDTSPEARAHFVRACRGRALVIIDSFLASCSGYIEENSSDTREPLDFLGQVSDATGAVILVIHHSKKDRTDTMTSARGTSAITDAVSLHITYEKAAHGPAELPTLRIGKTRHEPPRGAFTQPLRVAMAPSGGEGYTLIPVDERAVAAVRTVSLCDDVRLALTQGLQVSSIKALSVELGRREQDVREAVAELGLLRRKGIFVLP